MTALEIEEQLTAAVSTERLLETNAAIAQWTRHSGTAEERAAFAYVQAKLDEYGLRTTLLEHPALISYPLESSLAILDADGTVLAEYTTLGTAYSAGTDGLVAPLVDVGFGTPDELAAQETEGKILLINGLATPTAVYAAEQAGAAGQIFINDDHLHYMIVSSIWGTPTPESAHRIPTTPSLSVVEADGHDLRARVQAGPVQVRLRSRVFMEWQTTPILVGELDGRHSDEFVLFSGHLDSWEVGAMDNGSANATMLEVGRLLAMHRDGLYRGLRLVFWSGHSHGRYSGSTWYVDNHWEELYDRCVAHVNVDSTGARGATFYANFPANLELGPFAEEIVHGHTGQESRARRMSRAGDMSFNGVGIPALFMSLSQVPFSDADTDYVSLAFGKLIGGKMPWWWHTSEDTMDKVDGDVLRLDTQIYVSTLWRLCHTPLLPMDFRPVVTDLQLTLKELADVACARLDLSRAMDRASVLAEAVETLAQQCAAVAAADASGDEGELASPAVIDLNRTLMALSRILIPVTYTAAGQFDHDPAWGQPHLPGLAGARRLAQLDPASDDYHFLHTRLVRNRNQVDFALRQALDVVAGLADQRVP
ncbi:MAG: M28 family peptidase [Caldilineaceae bacterium]|nr:M28 family peptidase [Caldilineaceae bacterium]